MKKVLTILGARPQFIKAGAVSRIFDSMGIHETIVHTGQHFDKNMSDVFFQQMEIPRPKYNLGIHSLNHGAMTGRMTEEIEKVILAEKPEFLMVYGDTNSTIAGALAAKKIFVKVAHVEAGLRSFNMRMPEEINRILTDRISDFLFCPTQTAIDNLYKEGFRNIDCTVKLVGDVMYDAALYYSNIAETKALAAKDLKLTPGNFVLCTVHRQENTDEPTRLKSIFDALNQINKHMPVIMPIHPRTQKIIKDIGIKPGFKTIEPVGYFDIIYLLKNSKLVITDSGGMQKEACFFNKYCLTLRDETEWVELVDNKVNVLTGASKDSILEGFDFFLNKDYPQIKNLYGQGNASELIADCILKA